MPLPIRVRVLARKDEFGAGTRPLHSLFAQDYHFRNFFSKLRIRGVMALAHDKKTNLFPGSVLARFLISHHHHSPALEISFIAKGAARALSSFWRNRPAGI